VLDRATAKDLGVRYATARDLIFDLEDVLAIETARAGGATGEATQVLRTLSQPARARLPLRLRRSTWWLGGTAALALVVVAVVLVLAARQTERGTGTPRVERPPAGQPALTPVSLSSRAGDDFDPAGDNVEHDDEVAALTDNDTSTAWSTEGYSAGLEKAGVGVIVDASPGLEARALEVVTTTRASPRRSTARPRARPTGCPARTRAGSA
jgi:serine/threonine-protein kinase